MKNSNKLLIFVGLILISGLVFSNIKLKENHLETISNEKAIFEKYANVKHLKIKGNGLRLNLTKGDKNAFSNISQLLRVVDLKLNKDTMLIECLQCNQKNGSVFEYSFYFKMPTINTIEADSANVQMIGFKQKDLRIKGNKSNFVFNYVEFENFKAFLNHQSLMNFESTSKANEAHIISRDSSTIKIANLNSPKLKIDASPNSKVENLLKKQ